MSEKKFSIYYRKPDRNVERQYDVYDDYYIKTARRFDDDGEIEAENQVGKEYFSPLNTRGKRHALELYSSTKQNVEAKADHGQDVEFEVVF